MNDGASCRTSVSTSRASHDVLTTAVRLAVAAAAATIASLTLGATAVTAADAACRNEALRTEQSATFLGECRAYELVSPADVTPSLPAGNAPKVEQTLAARGGQGLAWLGWYPVENGNGGFYNVSTRTPGGWATEGVTPPQSTWQFPEVHNFTCQPTAVFGSELSSGILIDGEGADAGEGEGVAVNVGSESEFCGSNHPPLAEDEPKGFTDLFAMTLHPRQYEVINAAPPSVAPADALFQSASEDDRHVAFSEPASLTAEAPEGGDGLYEWSEGRLWLVSILPNGEATSGMIADGAEYEHGFFEERGERPQIQVSGAMALHAMSESGSRVVFVSGGNLYMRLHVGAVSHSGPLDAEECRDAVEACTIELDASQAGGSGGGGKFMAANATGSEVFFSDEEAAHLTSDTPAALGKDTNLYEYDVETGNLTDVTAVQEEKVLGYSGLGEDESGASLYFAAEGVLASGAPSRKTNLFLLRDKTVRFVASVSDDPAYPEDWQPVEGRKAREGNMGDLQAEASPDGEYLAFVNGQRLTRYNNTNRATGEREGEVYLYDGATERISCASCDPDEARPLASAAMPTASLVTQVTGPATLRRRVFDDGDVIFESPDPLVAEDENGQQDVYQWAEGTPQLISSGKSTYQSVFYEADATGENIFFATTQKLVRRDVNNAESIYDARVDGGFSEPASGAACEAEACHGAWPGGEIGQQPTSTTFSGPGNPSSEHGAPKTGKESKGAARRHKLAKALKACRRQPPKRRSSCRKRARRRYGSKRSARGARPKTKAIGRAPHGRAGLEAGR